MVKGGPNVHLLVGVSSMWVSSRALRERERVGHELKTGEVKALDDIPETPMDISGTYSPSLSLMYALVLVWLHARMRWLLGRPVRALLPHRLHA